MIASPETSISPRFRAPALPASARADDADRQRWVALLLSEAHKSGMTHLRVQRRAEGSDAAGAGPWFEVHSTAGPAYHLRAVLPNLICFDLGDNKADGTPAPWVETVMFTEAIWQACTNLGIPFHGGLSGGKGTHTEIWLPPCSPSRVDMQKACANCMHEHKKGVPRCPFLFEDGAVCPCLQFERERTPKNSSRRWQIAYRILGEAHRILWGDNEDGHKVDFDPRFIDPHTDAAQFREWGERKAAGNPKQKLLWHEGLGPAKPLPLDQADAYRQAEALAASRGRVRPASISTTEQIDTLDTFWVRELSGGAGCPQGPQCYDPTTWSCSDCPAGG